MRAEGAQQARAVEVRLAADLRRLGGVLFGERDFLCVVLTPQLEGSSPVLPLVAVRELVGTAAHIYFVSAGLLAALRVLLGAQLAVPRDSLRLFWPGASLQSSPLDHLAVEVLSDEPVEDSLKELARQLALSNPIVRREITQIDDLRRAAEIERDQLGRQLRAMTRKYQDATAGSSRSSEP